MISRISLLLSPIYSDPGIKMVALYRIDGVPVFIKINAPKREIAGTLYWLEGQIKEMLYQIFNRNLSEASFRFGDVRIHMYPVSRTLVLSIMASEEVSMYKLEVDVMSVKKQLGVLVGYEG
ncbi:hypothetical protein [Archaeoglobus veneficus]|uniref:Roadblock/LC7 family protein n=1 Tax=Archaeoglobus veneficus (strain DSM 11195 / SNP6) TaxID=693661 RepID=F2KNA8_ARCVS|nr:hypothetical protein [Archaeoglobus veneficus]AEA46209.1 hypothetical protein Arcve_0170 [Archaeoglobus veneficus SNP6]